MSMIEVGAVIDGGLFAGSATEDFRPPCIPGRRQWVLQESCLGKDGYDSGYCLAQGTGNLTNRQVVKANMVHRNGHM